MGPGRARASHGPRVSNPVLKDTAPVRAALDRRASRLLKKAHLLRWRPRSHAQRTESTPRVRPSGAASQLTPSRHPARSSVAWKCRRLKAHLLRWRPRQQVQRTESTPHLLPSGAASHLGLFERPARWLWRCLFQQLLEAESDLYSFAKRSLGGEADHDALSRLLA